jgi:hypothetical protein
MIEETTTAYARTEAAYQRTLQELEVRPPASRHLHCL